MQYEKFIIALGAHVWRMQVLNQGYFLPLSDADRATVDTLTWPRVHQLYPTLDHAVGMTETSIHVGTPV